MRLRSILPAAVLLAAGLMFNPLQSHAGTITIGLQLNGGSTTTVANDLGLGATGYTGTFGQFLINQINATGSGLVSPFAQGTLDTSSINVSAGGAAATLNIYITEQGLTSPSGLTNFFSSFNSQPMTGTGTSVTESTFYSTTNQQYGGTLLASDTFTGLNTGTSNNLANLTGTYSETVEYSIIKGMGGASVNDTVNLTATSVTPEPSSLLLLGTGLIGTATMVLRRRKLVA